MKLTRHVSSPPEDSVVMRVVVALAVELGVLAVVLQGTIEPMAAVAALVLAPLGYAFSHLRRARPSIWVKVALTVALFAAMANFFRAVGGVLTVDQARAPLAALFLWVQVLHAFDVPRRRDLAFSMVSSTTLVAVAGALSLSGTYVWVLLAWAALACSWLWLSASPRPDQVARPREIRRVSAAAVPRLARVRSATLAGLVAVVLGVGLFAVMPRLPAQLVRTPPFSLGDRDLPAPPQGAASTSNLGLPPAGSDGVVDFALNAYPGFSGAMDLRARGLLSDELAFRVRAERAALWRADVFDTFDGQIWTASDPDREAVAPFFPGDPPTTVERDFADAPNAQKVRLTQTFYLESDLPNVLFGADRIDEVYFPSGGLRSDRYGAVRAPILLEEGLVYSVVSEVPYYTTSQLQVLSDPPTERVRALQRYLQLPDSTSQRVLDLAARITAGARNPYERAVLVERWLQTNTRYDLTVAREPDESDAVDHFLFETQRGFCEHIASAMVVMLRASGVPARIATGFGPGVRNPLTGYFEVRQSDAHAWVEVLLPDGLGWMTFDPTFGVPSAEPSWASRFIAPEMFAAIGRVASAAIPASVKEVVGGLARAVVSSVGSIVALWPLALAAVGIIAVVAGWRRRRRRDVRAAPIDNAGIAFEEAVRALAAAGHARGPSTTPGEFLDEILADDALDRELRSETEVVIRTFERARFAPPSVRPGTPETTRARAAARRVRDLAHRP